LLSSSLSWQAATIGNIRLVLSMEIIDELISFLG
jgi:hypothetical protein